MRGVVEKCTFCAERLEKGLVARLRRGVGRGHPVRRPQRPGTRSVRQGAGRKLQHTPQARPGHRSRRLLHHLEHFRLEMLWRPLMRPPAAQAQAQFIYAVKRRSERLTIKCSRGDCHARTSAQRVAQVLRVALLFVGRHRLRVCRLCLSVDLRSEADRSVPATCRGDSTSLSSHIWWGWPPAAVMLVLPAYFPPLSSLSSA